MKRTTFELPTCPSCHGQLELHAATEAVIHNGTLSCPHCQKDYAIVEGIRRYIKPDELTGFNRRLARMYDWVSRVYEAFSRVAFAFIGMDEKTGRREITGWLDPRGGKALEVSVGPGVNLPYLVKRPDVGEVFGLDISLGQPQRCQAYARRRGWVVELFLGNGEQLPFRDESFDGLFPVGGINFFNNKIAAVDEMIRVAKSGTRLLIADETEKGAQGYEKFIPGLKGSFGGQREVIKPPMDLVPSETLETRVFDVWKGRLYCIEFRKPQNRRVV